MVKKRKKINVPIPVIIISLLLILSLLTVVLSLRQKPIGGDTDEHGCLIAAGYSWNGTDQMCVREWEKELCSPENRGGEVCITVYQPVCGLPVKKSFSNSCFACIDEEVKYYVPGECLK